MGLMGRVIVSTSSPCYGVTAIPEIHEFWIWLGGYGRESRLPIWSSSPTITRLKCTALPSQKSLNLLPCCTCIPETHSNSTFPWQPCSAFSNTTCLLLELLRRPKS